jgi:hypothetical protein
MGKRDETKTRIPRPMYTQAYSKFGEGLCGSQEKTNEKVNPEIMYV